MGLFNAILGNASSIDIEDVVEQLEGILFPGEKVESAFRVIRDKWVFTNKRLIIQDTQGVTGKKKEYYSIPYRSIERFSVETAGTFDMDAEIKIWVRGCDEPLEQQFGRESNVAEVQRVLAQYVL